MNLKLPGFLLLVAGWGLVFAALALLHTEMSEAIFVLSGLAVEILGLSFVVRAHLALPGKKER